MQNLTSGQEKSPAQTKMREEEIGLVGKSKTAGLV